MVPPWCLLPVAGRARLQPARLGRPYRSGLFTVTVFGGRPRRCRCPLALPATGPRRRPPRLRQYGRPLARSCFSTAHPVAYRTGHTPRQHGRRGVGDPPGDRGEPPQPGHDRGGAQDQHRRQRMDHPRGMTRVVDHREMIDQVHDRRVHHQVIAMVTAGTAITGRQRRHQHSPDVCIIGRQDGRMHGQRNSGCERSWRTSRATGVSFYLSRDTPHGYPQRVAPRHWKITPEPQSLQDRRSKTAVRSSQVGT